VLAAGTFSSGSQRIDKWNVVSAISRDKRAKFARIVPVDEIPLEMLQLRHGGERGRQPLYGIALADLAEVARADSRASRCKEVLEGFLNHCINSSALKSGALPYIIFSQQNQYRQC
jgi:hypothetical protein